MIHLFFAVVDSSRKQTFASTKNVQDEPSFSYAAAFLCSRIVMTLSCRSVLEAMNKYSDKLALKLKNAAEERANDGYFYAKLFCHDPICIEVRFTSVRPAFCLQYSWRHSICVVMCLTFVVCWFRSLYNTIGVLVPELLLAILQIHGRYSAFDVWSDCE